MYIDYYYMKRLLPLEEENRKKDSRLIFVIWFISYHIYIPSLRVVRIDWNLFHDSLNGWDPEEHVFWFNIDEICPTIEYFLVLLSVDSEFPTVIPNLQNSYLPSLNKWSLFVHFYTSSFTNFDFLYNNHIYKHLNMSTPRFEL